MDKEDKPKRPKGTGCVYKRKDSPVLHLKFVINGRTYRQSAGTDNPAKAQKILINRIAEVRQNNYLEPKSERTTVEELVEDVLRQYRNDKKKSTDDVEARWRLHLKPFFSGRRANDVSRRVLDLYVEARLKEDAANGTVNRELSLLKTALRTGLAADRIRKVPKFPHLEEDNARKGFVKDTEYDRLAIACSREGFWLRAMFETAYRLGWRAGELLGLRVKDVDLASRTIRIEDSKNGEPREAKIPNCLYPYIEQSVLGKDEDRYVFSRDSLGVRPIGTYREAWHKACCAAGLGKMLCPKCGREITADAKGQWKCGLCNHTSDYRSLKYVGLYMHDLRRSAAKNMRRSGVPESLIMRVAGWKTQSMFRRYAITDENDLEQVARRVDEGEEARKLQVHKQVHSAEISAETLAHAATA